MSRIYASLSEYSDQVQAGIDANHATVMKYEERKRGIIAQKKQSIEETKNAAANAAREQENAAKKAKYQRWLSGEEKGGAPHTAIPHNMMHVSGTVNPHFGLIIQFAIDDR